MIVDQDGPALRVVDGVSRKVDLLDRVAGKRGQVGPGVEAEVLRGDVDVVDIAEEPAASPRGERSTWPKSRSRRPTPMPRVASTSCVAATQYSQVG